MHFTKHLVGEFKKPTRVQRVFALTAQERDWLLPARTRITAQKKINGGRNHRATKIVGALRLNAG
jgi:hypothetical protein